MAGDFIIAVTAILISSLRNDNVTIAFSQVLVDLVQGELMQLGSKETENERFAHYLNKTYKKTASLIANSLKSVAILAGADGKLIDVAFQYGRNIGLAFQLVDDLLDFVSSSEAMGKPAAADLKLGLATAPVLFACDKYPELNPMIMRRFQEPGDVEKAFELVHKSQGLEQTQFLARQHCLEAARLANTLTESPYQKALQRATEMEKFILTLSSHESNMCKTLCTLMESQILVDLTINCKSYSLKIHKCVLAAKSGYFREKLQKDVTIDRILINGMKPSVLKSLITFIYCGGTSVAAEDMHDLITAADYFRIPGIMSILKDKFKLDLFKKTELNLEETPPLFFSNSSKVNTNKYNYNTMPIGVLSSKCNAPGKSKEARYLLAKEQAASQLALDILQKTKSKLVVTDEPCTEVTVEAELAPDFDDSGPIQEYILEDFDKNVVKPMAPVKSFNRHINEVFFLEPDNGQFVNGNNRPLSELPAGHTVSYQLIPRNKGDLEIQEYICNTINDYTVNSTSNVCYNIIPDKKIQMTYAEISSAAVIILS
ncbi:qless [Carabus blaptoides fortunei]